ncbi:DUF1836 domain-containing protein [Streptococcus suis]|uniref:DUF1836 domain-containing protein n=1 Tax=Streptococcus suis TaxID=1307 RepID=UPI0003FAD2C3|nr:DUF1836 domain-containing protein [Streptococcus suis]MBS8066653.1 DUF1836 domain-containing protein [Streptococcus suis]MBS8081199.1 DUF1836 domain-containing protein [Streptococcus suis]MBS8083152.1 DUF1836 domain-containing protein [Streptococcus suis]MBS8111431.1 DUF1836 domain-containing protein [Streptococcus suis]MCB2862475.1 DUF1836 domain-containing protein [Streptococcus suis]
MKQTIPYWHELPDLDLYLDQVLLYVNQVVNSQKSLEQNCLNSMKINSSLGNEADDRTGVHQGKLTTDNVDIRRVLTAAMINNYVKHRQLEKPVKKKYQKQQVARLIALTILKNVFSIQEISQTLHLLLQTNSSETLYNHFVDCMRNEENEETPDIIRYACQSVKLYYKTRQLTMELERSHHES